MSNWQPLNETVFVKPEEIKASHLVPEHLKASLVELRTGVVVKTGTGTLMEFGKREPLQVKEGDRILFGAKTGHEVEVDGEKYLLLAEANILAVERN